MASKAQISTEIVARAEAHDGIQAGIASLSEVLQGPSYRAASECPGSTTRLDDARVDDWPAAAGMVLVLGLHHSADDPRLDYWELGDTWGNRRLREIARRLKRWLGKEHSLSALPLPYHVEKGGMFLKDAAVLSGLGIIGRNNLLVNPQWGPRIRLRAVLLEADLHPTEPLEGFDPCDGCEIFCQNACPVKAFAGGEYSRPMCTEQMNEDVKNQARDGEPGEKGLHNRVVKYCRACELSCPVGA